MRLELRTIDLAGQITTSFSTEESKMRCWWVRNYFEYLSGTIGSTLTCSICGRVFLIHVRIYMKYIYTVHKLYVK